MIRRAVRTSLLSMALAILTAVPAAAQRRLAITSATIVDVTDGSLHPDQNVIIEGNRIVAVGTADEVPVPEGAEEVDAAGGYLIPGLWDMHVHVFFQGLDGYLALFVANGVTGIREMGNSPMSLAEIRAVRVDVASGRRVGPRFIAPGVLVDGPNSRWSEGVVRADAPERGRAVVDSLAAEGADFIKVYSYLQPDVYAAIVEQAKRRRLPVAGHVPYLVRAADAATAGQSSFEHLIGIEDGCSAEESALVELGRQELEALARGDTTAVDSLEREWRRRVVATQNDARCRTLFDHLREHGTFQVPTLVQQQRPKCTDAEALTRDPRLKYVPPLFVDSYWSSVIDATRGADLESERSLCALRTAQVGTLARSGVPLLAGSDAGWPWVIWGFSLHEELELLVEAGLTPLQALQAATLNPARYLRAIDSLGTVATGKLADLVVVDGDPLESISNTQRIRAVIANGRLYRRADLDRLLAGVEASNGRGASRQ